MPSWNPSSLEKGAKAVFNLAYEAEDEMVKELTMYQTSESDREMYPWIGQTMQMVERKDTGRFTPVSDSNMTIVNKTFQAGIDFKEEDFKDQKNNLITNTINGLAETASCHPSALLTDFITLGTGTTLHTPYDGNAFFSTTHPARGSSGAQSNLLTGTGVSAAQFQADYIAARSASYSFKDEAGEPFWKSAKTPMFFAYVPPALEKVALDCCSAIVVSQTTNTLVNTANVRMNPRLTTDSATDWYLFAITKTRRPFVFQEREKLSFSALDTRASDGVFRNGIYSYQATARYNIGYGFWQCAVKTNNT